MIPKRIGIIGAGIAGLACATELSKAGHHVTLFDKSRGVGGRMSHRHYEKWGADHGAQYFTAKNPRFIEEAQRWLNAGVIEPWDAKIVSLTDGVISPLEGNTERYVGVPAMTAPAKFLAQELDVKVSTNIIEIRQINDLWRVVSKEEGLLHFSFDFLISAIPSVQASGLVAGYSNELKEVCSRVKMLPCWTLMAYFKDPLPLDFDGAFVNHHLFSWIARDNAKPGRSVYESWVAQASNQWSHENLAFTQFEIEPILVKVFEDLTGQVCDLYQTHLWRYSKLETPSEQNCVSDFSVRLGLCGDWLRNSTVEGAWLSGYFMGRSLIETKEA